VETTAAGAAIAAGLGAGVWPSMAAVGAAGGGAGRVFEPAIGAAEIAAGGGAIQSFSRHHVLSCMEKH
jgi:glycerol kinase